MSVYGFQIDEQPKLRDRLNNAMNQNKQMQSLNTDLSDVKGQIEKLNDKINRLTDLMSSKACKDDTIDFKNSISSLKTKVDELDLILNNFVDKPTFKKELDEISQCFEDFVISATPRIQPLQDVTVLENRLRNLEESIMSQPKINIRSAVDIDSKICSESDRLFKRPEKKSH